MVIVIFTISASLERETTYGRVFSSEKRGITFALNGINIVFTCNAFSVRQGRVGRAQKTVKYLWQKYIKIKNLYCSNDF